MTGFHDRVESTLLAMALCCLSCSAGAANLYVANNLTERMFVIDTDTVSGVLLGDSGIDIHFGGLGFATDGTLYGYRTAASAENRPTLWTVNKTTGEWSFVGVSEINGGDGFDIDPTTNKGYTAALPGFGLHEIDLSTGNATLVNANGRFFSGAAFAPDGTLYITNSPGPVAGQLSTLDVTTAFETAIGEINISEAITSLAFNPDDGFLYAVSTFTAQLYRINPSTAVAENLGVIADIDHGGQYTMGTIQVTVIPIPAAIWLFGSALALIGGMRRNILVTC